MDFAQLVIISILVETIWENLKMIYDKKKFSWSMLASLLLSMLVCTLAKVDIFAIVGINLSIPFIGYILTGIITSRGANVLHDLINKLKK